MKGLGHLRYFLRIEITRSPKDFSLSQRKYLIDLLEETSTLGSKHIYTPMDHNIRFNQNLGEPLADLEKYKRMIGKLSYLTVTRPNITFIIGVLSRYMQSLYPLH